MTPAARPGDARSTTWFQLCGVVSRVASAPAHDDPFRLASLIWTAEHGLVLARMSRPVFPWAPIDDLVDEMVTRLMAFDLSPRCSTVD